MADIAILLLMVIFAGIALHSPMLRLSVIALSIFSLLGALLFVLYSAPELAIAEAAIGSGLVALLFLTALKRYAVVTVCVICGHGDCGGDQEIRRMKHSPVMKHIRAFLLQREREAQLVFTTMSVERSMADPRYDLVVVSEPSQVTVHGFVDDYLVVELEMSFQMHGQEVGQSIRFMYHEDPEDEK